MATIRRYPDSNSSLSWRIECECGQVLPFDTYTKCSRCGAHYRGTVEQVAPSVTVNDE